MLLKKERKLCAGGDKARFASLQSFGRWLALFAAAAAAAASVDSDTTYPCLVLTVAAVDRQTETTSDRDD